MKFADKTKMMFVAAFTALNGWLGCLAVPFYFLLLTNLIDYTTGIVASVCRGEKVSSNTGFRGIAKKVCMWLLVLVGYIIDYIFAQLGTAMNVTVGFSSLVALAVIFWLMANELISILENISDVGVPMPAFLLKLAQFVKDKTEETVTIGEK